MPKAKKVKRSVTCGKCKETGHNARTCLTVEAVVAEAAVPVVEAPTPPKPKAKIDIHDEKKRMSTVPRRDAPTANTGATANHAPYRCQKCYAVAILVVVRVKDHNASFKEGKEIFKGDVRCEQCMNKPNPAELILKWGASPNEVVPIPGQDDA